MTNEFNYEVERTKDGGYKVESTFNYEKVCLQCPYCYACPFEDYIDCIEAGISYWKFSGLIDIDHHLD